MTQSPGDGTVTFADVLRRLRTEARMTQEELAEAATLSPRSVSDLERGINRTARKGTAVLLADALSLPGDVRELFVAVARGRAPAEEVLAAGSGNGRGEPAAATRALPRDTGSFTGRQAELERLLGGSGQRSGGPGEIRVIDGMAGAGKTTLAVHAAHRLAPGFPDGQFFVPLHAHTPGHRPVDPTDALASLLMTAGVPAQNVPSGRAAREGRWRDFVAGKKIVLVLDDAADHEQVRPLLPGSGGSLVLVTSRRRLTALADVTVVSIDAMAPDEATTLLAQLAGRPDLEAGSDAAGEIARLCGYLPLAIGMLAAHLRHHPARAGAEMAADLAASSDRLGHMYAENLSVAAAFDLSYANLKPAEQQLFRRLGLAPGRDIDGYAAAVLDETSLTAARQLLDELYDHHLITEPAPGRYLLHDLLREYARALALADEEDSRAAASRMVNYYGHAAAAASTHIATWTTAGGRPPHGPPPSVIPLLQTHEQAAAWLEAERPNLHAAAGYAAAHAMPQHAVSVATAIGGFLRARGYWDQAASLYQTALAAARAADDPLGQAGTLDELGLLQQLTGDYQAAAGSLAEAAELFRRHGDRSGLAYALNHLGLVQHETGQYQEAAANHQHALALARDAGDRLAEAVSLTDLGMVQQLTGDYSAAIASYQQAIPRFRDLDSRYDLADALSELGTVRCLTGDYEAAASDHRQALELFRQLGDRLGQAWALDGLGEVSQLTGDGQAAASLEQALQLYRELGNRNGEARVLNSLGELSARSGSAADARARHGEALGIARDLSAPLEQARALEGIGRTFLRGSPAEAGEHLRQALAIYQRIGAPAAKHTRELLDQYGL